MAAHKPINARHLGIERCFYGWGLPLTEGHTANMRLLSPKLPSDPTVEAFEQLHSIDMGSRHISCGSHNVAHDSSKNHSQVNICQGESVPAGKNEVVESLGKRIRRVRSKVLRLNQAQFANRLGVSQSNVSKWEAGLLRPEMQHLMRVAEALEGNIESVYFMEAAGVPVAFLEGDPKYSGLSVPSEFITSAAPSPGPTYLVPLLRDGTVAGTPHMFDEGQVETYIPWLKKWSPPGASLLALRVKGDCGAPMIQDGAVVIFDTAQRDANILIGQMVVARDTTGVTIKRLQRDADTLMLVPLNVSEYPIIVLKKEVAEVLGVLVKWIGDPPAPPRRR